MAVKRSKGSPERIGGLISSRFEGTALGGRLKDLAIWQLWDQTVGSAIARRTRPLRLSSGQLTVLVSGAPWMHQLNFMKDDLRSKLNSNLGDERVKEIVFKAGRINDPETAGDEKPAKPLLRQLSVQQQHWIDAQISDIEDNELAASLRGLMELHYRRRS